MEQILEAIYWDEIKAFFSGALDWIDALIEPFFTHRSYGHALLTSVGIVLAFMILAAAFNKWMPYKVKRILTRTRIICVGVFLAAVAWFLPVYMNVFSDLLEAGKSTGITFKVVEASFQNAMRLFAVDDSYLELLDYAPKAIRGLYAGWGFLLYICAPILTVGFVLTFLKNITAYIRYTLAFRKQAHVFSELNEHTLALASSIDAFYNKNAKGKYKMCRKAMIVFCDILHRNEEEHLDLMEAANEMGAILFRKDVTSVLFLRNRMHFYLISEDESEKLQHAVRLMSRYDHKNNKLFLFSNTSQSALLISTKATKKMEVRRINAIQSLIYDNLEKNGVRLFRNAKDGAITAVIVGLGRYGLEMLKALVWFCQMDGYRITIHAFDSDPKAEEKLNLMCPELLKKNNLTNLEDAIYEIHVHSMDVNSVEFLEKLGDIVNVTYTFVGLGTDDNNIAVSTRIRTLYSGMINEGKLDHAPDVETIVYDANVKQAIGYEWRGDENSEQDGVRRGGVNHKDQPYCIHMIGDLDTFYSYDTLIGTNTELKKAGEEVHARWAQAGAIDGERKPKILEMLRERSYMHKIVLVKVKDSATAEEKVSDAYVTIPVEESDFENGEQFRGGRQYVARIEQLLCDHYKELAAACVYETDERAALIRVMEEKLPAAISPEADDARKRSYAAAVHTGAAHIRALIAPYALTLCITEEILTKNLVLNIVSCGLLEQYRLLEKQVKKMEDDALLQYRLLDKWEGIEPEQDASQTETVRLIVRDRQMRESSVMVLTVDELSRGTEAGTLLPDGVYDAIVEQLRCRYREQNKGEDVQDAALLWEQLRTPHKAVVRRKKKADKPKMRVFGALVDLAAKNSLLIELTDRAPVFEPEKYNDYIEKYRTLEQVDAVCAATLSLSYGRMQDKPQSEAKKAVMLLTVGDKGQIVSCEAMNPHLMKQEYYTNKFPSQKLYQLAVDQLYNRYRAKTRGEGKGKIALIDWEWLMASDSTEYFVLDMNRHTVDMHVIYDGVTEHLKGVEPVKTDEEKWKFWRHEYFYRSSVAKAMHERLRSKLCQEKLLKDDTFAAAVAAGNWRARNAEQTLAICRVEHRRWNAFMRTEGFRYAEKRNDLAKHHNKLVPTNQLSDNDLRMDA
ncbi:MAG: hypothetical protein IJW97_01290 [Clostridia bacterium]|nr:hypothetical protein [Clostridia bacterium]